MATPSPAGVARRSLRERYGAPEAGIRVASAPGRVNLIGGHTDYNDGFVLPVAIDRRTAVAIRPRPDDRVRAYATAYDEEATFSIGAGVPTSGWTEYLRGVFRQLSDAGLDVPGADLAVAGDLPIGAGLASSAALETATAAAVRAIADGHLDDAALARACWRAETETVGVECGIMDQFAAVFGRADAALFLDCRTGAHVPVGMPTDVALVVIDTTVEHELADSAYNERRAACRRAAERLDEVVGGVTALRDVSTATLAAHADSLPENLRPQARHVVAENERVIGAKLALDRGDLTTVGELMGRSHASLRDDYEVSCTELDAAVEIALGVEGVHGARMTGAGFGGSAVALARPDAIDALVDRIATAFPDRTGVEPAVYPCRPAAGVRLEG